MDRLRNTPEDMPRMALVYSPPGYGKTKAIAWYAINKGEQVNHVDGRRVRVVGCSEDGDALRLYDLDDSTASLESELIPDIRDIGAKERLASIGGLAPPGLRN